MKYAVIVYESPEELAKRQHPEHAPAYWAAYAAYHQALIAAGVAAGGAGLEPPTTATSLRVRGGLRDVQDGPFVETRDLLGGFFVIDVPDADAALLWASRCPSAATGGVEVRPVLRPIG